MESDRVDALAAPARAIGRLRSDRPLHPRSEGCAASLSESLSFESKTPDLSRVLRAKIYRAKSSTAAAREPDHPGSGRTHSCAMNMAAHASFIANAIIM